MHHLQGHFAGMGGSVQMCAWLAEECGVPLDRRQRSGHTALHKAADCGQKDVISYLLGHLSADQLRRVGLCADEEIAFAAANEARAAADDEVASVVTQDAKAAAVRMHFTRASAVDLFHTRSAHLHLSPIYSACSIQNRSLRLKCLGLPHSRKQVTNPDGEPLSKLQMDERRNAHLPSSLAMKRGHTACAKLLHRVGL